MSKEGIFMFCLNLVKLYGCRRAGSRPVQQMPMHLSDFDGDAYPTVCIGQILKSLLLL